jgi:3-hydroxyacyl-[acyl-carrier-protein] dehydratase
MPPQPLFDLSMIDVNDPKISQEEIYSLNPHRFEFMLLDGAYFVDNESGVAAGYRDAKDDEFWVRGHIPGRPLFPGVLMIEAAAQLVSYQALTMSESKGFLGFAGVDNVKFRGQVVPGQRLVLLSKALDVRPRRCIAATQGWVDGQMVYEGTITGMWI